MLAEIVFDPEAISAGSTADTSDKLAQRNLSLVTSANPGDVTSRRISNTFELKPTRGGQGTDADELMIDWGNTPSGSFARIFLTVNADEILELAARRYSPAQFKHIDKHTIECRVQNITYIPIPVGPPLNHTAFLTVDLPPGVKKGQQFDLLVRQITPFGRKGSTKPGFNAEISLASSRLGWRRVLGSFQISIPVTT